MSNSRRFRRQLSRDVAFVLPPIADDASSTLKDALAIRNAATTSGRCQCGAEMELNGQDDAGIPHVVIRHESDCPASSVNVIALSLAERARR